MQASESHHETVRWEAGHPITRELPSPPCLYYLPCKPNWEMRDGGRGRRDLDQLVLGGRRSPEHEGLCWQITNSQEWKGGFVEGTEVYISGRGGPRRTMRPGRGQLGSERGPDRFSQENKLSLPDANAEEGP